MRSDKPLKAIVLLILATSCARAQMPRTAGLESYLKAREVLDAGVEAIGGLPALRAIKTVRRQLSGDWFGSGQGQRPSPVKSPTLMLPSSNSHNRIMSFVDYGRNRWFEEAMESDSTGDFITRTNAVTESVGFQTIIYRDEKPYYQAFSAKDLYLLRLRKFRRFPEGLLLMASSRPETLEWVGSGEEFGRRQRVISFADPTGTRVFLYFDEKTNLLTKSETLRDHPIAGDSFSEVIYDDYRPVGNLTLPFHYTDRVAGVPSEEQRASSIELDASLPDERYVPPLDFVRVEDDPSEPTVEKLGDDLYLIRGPYNSVFAAFHDYIMVFEAPLNGQYSATCLNLIRATVPGKPIRYVVSTHFHFDHIGGVRTYVAEGIPILTTPDAKGVIEAAVASRHTMHPDELSQNPKTAKIQTIEDKEIFDDGTNRVELYDFGPTDHVTQMLVAYFPNQKLLFEPDVWDIPTTELVIAGSDTVNMAKQIQERGLQVERIIPVHGVPGTIEMLNGALAVRAKYIK